MKTGSRRRRVTKALDSRRHVVNVCTATLEAPAASEAKRQPLGPAALHVPLHHREQGLPGVRGRRRRRAPVLRSGEGEAADLRQPPRRGAARPGMRALRGGRRRHGQRAGRAARARPSSSGARAPAGGATGPGPELVAVQYEHTRAREPLIREAPTATSPRANRQTQWPRVAAPEAGGGRAASPLPPVLPGLELPPRSASPPGSPAARSDASLVYSQESASR